MAFRLGYSTFMSNGGPKLFLILIGLCALGCRQPLEPTPTIIDGPRSSFAIATDSACRVLSMTLVGNNNVTVTFPNRATCGNGLVIIPAGTPTRSGSGKRNVNVPVRLLNRSVYAVKSPALSVLPPSSRAVLDPTGQPASKIIPQNADSLRPSGEWVWLVGNAGTVQIGDSTSVKTLTIRLDSPVVTGWVALTMDGVQVTAMGWTLLTTNVAAIDVTKKVQRPGTNLIMYRTAAIIKFKPEIDDQAKQTFFSQNSLTVLGVTPSKQFYVSFPDPGTSISAYDAVIASLRASPSLQGVLEAFHSGAIVPQGAIRFPTDAHSRTSWLFPNPQIDSLWGMRAIRMPLAWGCETGMYGGATRVAVMEWTHDFGNPDYVPSVQSSWVPPGIVTGDTVSLAVRDSSYRHSAAVLGLLTAEGDNTKGMAGVAWRTDLRLLALRSNARVSALSSFWYLAKAELITAAPRILNISVEARFGQSMTAQSRATAIEFFKDDWRQILDTLPNLLIVVASGNDALTTTSATYIASGSADLFKAGLFALITDPALLQYRDRVVVVTGTGPGPSVPLWPNANVFTDVTDIAAPAQNVMTLDSTFSGSQPVRLRVASGTSLAAPQVAGVAALLTSLDPSLSPSQVKQYLVQGASTPRNDSTSTTPVTPPFVSGFAFRQLDAYGSLSAVSKARAGSPICGYPVTAGFLNAYLQRLGPLAGPTDSIKVPGAANAVGRLSVAQGGRRLALYTGADSIAAGPAVVEFSQVGQRLGYQSGYRARQYLEKGIATIWQPSGPSSTQISLSDGLTGSIGQLTFPDGTVVGAIMEAIDVSPDGKYVAYGGARVVNGQLVSGLYLKRFSDQAVAVVRECINPCAGGGFPAPRWNHQGNRLVATSYVEDPATVYTGYLQTFKVDTTASITITPGPLQPIPDRTVGYGAAFSGDDMHIYLCELSPTTSATWLAVRPVAQLSAAATFQPSMTCAGEDRRIANVVSLKGQ